MKKRIASRLAACVLSGVLGACGGGGGDDGDPPQAARAEGAYGGTMTGSSSDSFNMVVLENDQFWTIYGDAVGDTFYVQGFMVGQGASNGGTYSATAVSDFNINGTIYTPSVSATYNPGVSAQGTLTYPGGTVSFSGTAASLAPYQYNQAALLSSVVGSWSLEGIDGSPVDVVVQADGAVTALNEGCTAAGTMGPRPSGKNVFDVVLTVGPAPCEEPGQVLRGIGIHSPIAGTSAHQLIVALTDDARTVGSLAVGWR